MESIEASGKSVDDAILQGLARLKKRRDEVDVTIVQEPSRGAFGIGNKDARVRLTVRPAPASVGAIITPEMADALLGPDDEGEEETYDEEEDGEFEEEEFEEDEYEEEDGEFEEEELESEEDAIEVPVLEPEAMLAAIQPDLVAGEGSEGTSD